MYRMDLFIAGRDKPHRCPGCWTAYGYAFAGGKHEGWWIYRSFNPVARRIYRLRLWFPRRCTDCGAVALTRFPRRLFAERMGVPERLENWVVARYYRWYACPRGKHRMKLSGCMYCGEGNEQIRFNVRGPGL
jgi:hypothetical protein